MVQIFNEGSRERRKYAGEPGGRTTSCILCGGKVNVGRNGFYFFTNDNTIKEKTKTQNKTKI